MTMNKILESLLTSGKTEKEKKAAVRAISQAGNNPQSPQDVVAMLQTTMQIMLDGSSGFQWEAAKSVYKSWASANKDELREFFNTNILHYLMDERFTNGFNAVWIIRTSLLELRLDKEHISAYDHLCDIIMRKSIQFVRTHPQYEILTPYCQLLFDIKICIPRGEFTVTFCKAIITAVSTYSLPRNLSDPMMFITDVTETIGGLLKHIWDKSDDECVWQCLQKLFDLIKYVDDKGAAPAIALAGIVKNLPTTKLDQVLGGLVHDASVDAGHLRQALENMINWLQWPLGGSTVHRWVVGFLQQLAAARRYSLIIEVAENNVEKVFFTCEFTAVRESAFAVLSYLLLSLQHSPIAFHKVADRMPRLLVIVRNEAVGTSDTLLRETCVSFLHRLADLLHCLMYRHPGFPDIYEPILDAVKDLPRPSIDQMERRLAAHRWAGLPDARLHSASLELQRKSSTGKLGLANLGNTCYMNSVLQALFMCDMFVHDVLSCVPGPREPAKIQLQRLFAMLIASQRPFLTPLAFASACRPPWFEDGLQHDCSEFLKFLLDQLHEQEVSVAAGTSAAAPGKASREHHSHSIFRKKKKPSVRAAGSAKSAESSSTAGECVSPRSLVEKTYTGRVLNTYTCLTCKHQSHKMEKFTDLPLAFPSSADSADPASKAGRALSGGSSCVKTLQGSGAAAATSGSGREQESIGRLLGAYLRPERLCGENRYHCSACGGLQDAERALRIVQSPEYLVLTLLRFSFDPKTQRHAKVFTDVRYPRTLYLPVHYSAGPDSPTSPTATHQHRSHPPSTKSSSSSSSSHSKAAKSTHSPTGSASPQPCEPSAPPRLEETHEAYALTAVIVHSGLSSDGGHYYTYARHSKPNASPRDSDNADTADADYLDDTWFLFNDHRVTESSYASFSSVTQKFSKDTAYVLFYKRVEASDLLLDDDPGSPAGSAGVNHAQVTLRSELRKIVDTDNTQYVQELERAEQLARSRRGAGGGAAAWFGARRDHNGDRGGGGGGMGGGFDGPRLVF